MVSPSNSTSSYLSTVRVLITSFEVDAIFTEHHEFKTFPTMLNSIDFRPVRKLTTIMFADSLILLPNLLHKNTKYYHQQNCRSYTCL